MKHAGELAVQHKAGVRAVALGSARARPEVPAVAAEFLGRQRMLLIGALGRNGLPWATALTGPEGFAEAVDERTVVIKAVPGGHDPLAGLDEGEIGMLAIEPWSRRRMRVNGTVLRDGGRLVVRTEQTYANCPKYIQARDVVAEVTGPATGSSSATAFGDGDRAWIEGADTFFIATSAPGLGADLSHRGGNPGFVRVMGDRRLVWPDYVGNSMYMTLGNLELDERCGLLFLDWENGDALHLTGRARVDWDPGGVPGAQRLVGFELDRIIRVQGAGPLRWRLGEYSRHNPPAHAALTAGFGLTAGPGRGEGP
ncbi:pyridoxamine 5'-phosphate oxidase family protein [Streptosporangium sp. NBC_01755]|uniref:pyridoxamine 5'-phosphate oxidase family protein n=1 Tax=unclassified Streptosporangium TaxID=2632669 RepID=UPI002DD7AA82|nr:MULTISPECIES: pyridoxamine 5'-phosphate oxidase family protein [unclassified Streptosporangium]WSA24327.1 pyridoxamine 5'-phosphate oxidase family protein [Streptosporangium sp. NBC_01810]WSC97599.1 pyridoxamine 5'-phosphate oxidase family protein [Streptosporangium sp. NBC_01755]